jgi:UDP-N-acetylglucosamine transferase subunit ALG13
MIFVTVGTGEQPFDRLLRSVEALSIDEPLVIQHGSSTVAPEEATCLDYLPFPDMVTRMQEARVVITHAGVGSVIAALSVGKKPVVVPRRRHFGEAVDDHQVELARRLADAGVVTLIDDPRDLAAVLAERSDREDSTEMGEVAETPLVVELREYLESYCLPTAAGRT